MVCVLFVNLVEWKIWKKRKPVCWTKITIIYNLNLKNVYQMMDIQPWSGSLNSVQVWVIKKSYNFCTCTFNIVAKILRRTLIACDSFSWLVNIQADFGSALNTHLLDEFFARTELLALAGGDSLVLVGQKGDRGKTRSSSVDVRDFCFLPIQPHRCRTVSSSVRWKLV